MESIIQAPEWRSKDELSRSGLYWAAYRVDPSNPSYRFQNVETWAARTDDDQSAYAMHLVRIEYEVGSGTSVSSINVLSKSGKFDVPAVLNQFDLFKTANPGVIHGTA